MATSANISVDADVSLVFAAKGLTQESAKKTSTLLQKNHENHHIFFNESGFHNHIVHHLLALLALGAPPEVIQKQYNDNISYQQPLKPVHQEVAPNLGDKTTFTSHLGKEENYPDYLVFFKQEIDKNGYEALIKEYLFTEDDLANDMLVRLFSGLLHPIIHIGYAVEFRQPALVAEALAESAVSSNWIGPLFLKAEAAAAATGPSSKSLNALATEARNSPVISTSAHESDSNKILDGILKRAPSEMIALAAQWTVAPDELEQKTAEAIAFSALFTGCAQRKGKAIKFDFFYIHTVNTAVVLQALLDAPFLSVEQKCRLLEWKGRGDLAMYVSRGAPELFYEEIGKYEGKQSWEELFARVNEIADDGHTCKLVRALAFGERLCGDKDGLVLKRKDWRVLANMVVDSVVAPGPRWVRGAGFEEAWKDVLDRQVAKP